MVFGEKSEHAAGGNTGAFSLLEQSAVSSESVRQHHLKRSKKHRVLRKADFQGKTMQELDLSLLARFLPC